MDHINRKRLPRFAIGWSRLVSRAAAEVEAGQLHLTIDHLKLEITPLILNVDLLPYSLGLPLTPMSLNNDGCAEVVFDPEAGQVIIPGYIRKIFKNKYVYADEIVMYRGKKIIVEPVAGKRMYLDGEIWDLKDPALEIEIFQEKIRLFKSAGVEE
jgi:diacylglycerol kinase family enzyme